MLHKIITYQTSPVEADLQKPLLIGEFLYADPETWGSDYIELLVGYHDDNGYETNGIPANHDYIELYERNAAWSPGDLLNLINNWNFIFTP